MGKQSNFKVAVNELMNGVTPKDSSIEEEQALNSLEQSKTDNSSSGFFSSRDRNDSLNRSANNSVIAEDLIIEGSINGKSSIQINGQVKGNVTTAGDIMSRGIIEGDAKGVNVTLNHSNIKGNITATGQLSVDNDSIIVGDINAGNVEINGKVKGDIRAEELVILKKAALVLGNLTAKSVSMEAGSGLKGNLEVLNDKISEKEFNFNSDRSTVRNTNIEEVLKEEKEFIEESEE